MLIWYYITTNEKQKSSKNFDHVLYLGQNGGEEKSM